MDDLFQELEEFKKYALNSSNVHQQLGKINLRRVQRISFLVFLVEMIFWIVYLIPMIENNHWMPTPFHAIHGVLLLISALGMYTTSFYLFRQRYPNLKVLTHGSWIFTMLILCLYGILSGMNREIAGGLSLYFLFLMMTSMLLYVRWPYYVITYTIPHGCFVLSMVYYRVNHTGFILEITIGTIFYILSILLARFLYINQALHLFKTSESIKLKEELQHHIRHDPLTGLNHREYFLELISRELDMIQRQKKSAALLLLDIDMFKIINDAYGHVIGNEALIHVTKQVNFTLRHSDIFARWGGEEFAILLSFVSQKEVEEVCQRIQQRLKEHLLVVDYARVELTLSMGVAMMTAPYHSSVDRYTQIAEEALYEAKRRGKNQYYFAKKADHHDSL